MSIDIASSSADLPAAARSLSELTIADCEVYAFDFDGVVIASDEDDIYHLDGWDGEADLLAAVADKLHVRCQEMEMKYQRHLLFQAAAFVLEKRIEAGVGFEHSKRASDIGQLFLITARSGWHAVERMRIFLKENAIVPVEVFNLGRVKKDRQIDLLCKEFPHRAIHYIEDNKAHLAAVAGLTHKNLSLVWAERQVSKKDPAELRQMVIETLSAVL